MNESNSSSVLESLEHRDCRLGPLEGIGLAAILRVIANLVLPARAGDAATPKS